MTVSFGRVAVHIFLILLAQCCCLGAVAYAADSGLATRQVLLEIEGVPYEAELTINKRLLAQRKVRGLSNSLHERAVHFQGSIRGFPDSSVRLSQVVGQWRGVLVFSDRLYRVDDSSSTGSDQQPILKASRVMAPTKEQKLCDDPIHSSAKILRAASSMRLPVELASVAESVEQPVVLAASSAGAADCPDPVDGICVMPEIELVYDLSYQALLSPGETVLDRATRELNGLDMFFERSFNYRFSRVSMTFLDATQDAPFASYNTAGDLLDALRLARTRAEMPYVQSPRSILHFMTGRDFPVDRSGTNTVGIAYLDVFCETFGLNTGLTDAGDAFFVSLVMAHEIGHNLGARHDDVSTNGCIANTHIMSGSLDGLDLNADFSSCSVAYIQPNVASALAGRTRSQCLDFPVNLTVSSDPANVSVPQKNTAFTSYFNVDRKGGNRGITNLQIDGTIGVPEQGRFLSVSVAGGRCSVQADSYTCTVNNSDAELVLEVTTLVESNASEFGYDLTVRVTGGDAVEYDSSDNNLIAAYTEFLPESSGVSGGSASSVGKESGGSGGGGSWGLFTVLQLLILTGAHLVKQCYVLFFNRREICLEK